MSDKPLKNMVKKSIYNPLKMQALINKLKDGGTIAIVLAGKRLLTGLNIFG